MIRLLPAILFLALSGCDRKDPHGGKTVEDLNMALEILRSRSERAPEVGTRAPSFTVYFEKTGKPVKLSKFWKTKGCVLFFGSLSCDITISNADAMKAVAEEFSGSHQFVLVYLREAHPVDGWEYDGPGFPKVKDPATLEIRRNVCSRLRVRSNFSFPAVVDALDDRAAVAYAAWPSRVYVIDTGGIVRYRSRPGPLGYRIREDSRRILFENPEELQGLEQSGSDESLEAFLKRSVQAGR